MKRAILATAFLLAASNSGGCRSSADTAQGVAERFVDQHYVEMNLPAAEPYCTGVALGKVRESMRLTQGMQIDQATRRPTVRYRVSPHSESDKDASFLFDATIQVEGAETFDRRWIVLTKKVGDTWKVANFTEE
ncbi:MAG TPA: hypothetical protein VEB21_02075 [Terriglobales bacterium]|nr:hypothetical protein [Terriglobales bacterium]